MYNIEKIMDNMFGLNDAFFRYNPIFNDNALSTYGFKSILKRPHNLIEVHDDDGNLISQRLEVTTTPFTKDQVKVIINNNILTVSCGSEQKVPENESVIYRGISAQTYTFSLSIPDTIDQKKISAVNKDGILKIDMPVKKEKESEVIEINID